MSYPDWALEGAVCGAELPDGSTILIEVLPNINRWTMNVRKCIISFSDDGRMLFDGEDIETEDFMGFVGLIDTITESKTKAICDL